ncbi:ubiquitin carboxyl-terminal hydrolase 12 [Phtheirospermum japonicum]|uniref:Ubiquitin carboxyl-terminal hydrolase 12 n=1 Tax=Phtheirospermum japonicum TaxID=374723 RepID=A0A830BJH3_9LAMI|nr:ubiquitin carboxyl-terminal hydrolase 12 [Phtheirospermum japonicum]
METREASPAHLLIKIESFSLLEKHGIEKYETRELESGEYKWRLIIYLNGQDYVSVYLAIADTSALPANWEVNAVFSIRLFNHTSGNYRYALGTRRFHALKPEWCFQKFILKKDLIDPLNGYLINDKCVFGAEVFVNENKAVTECLSLKSVDTDPYKQEFKTANFSTIKDVWTSDEFTVGVHKWEIWVYPNGDGEVSGRSLSIFLHRVVSNNSASSERVRPFYTIRIKD